ncbi:LCP family protein [Lysinibacillus sp. SGAir0095]|uniref:LCP family protein n=1 Tax=Lysinibacillus sp. SGAir0095 TaxID=2070463 RepID=UPI0010CD11A4|nr:LCP family protein [Lysinibacillus sp. SGAir0095]QCR31061.1 LytR family transcriptional regulator [Lysinibacillus sp. SGAir0095]
MEDKSLKDRLSNQELKFTKEDRAEVFEKLHKLEKNVQKKPLVSFSKKLAPLTVTLLAVGLCLFFIMPSILQGNTHNEENGTVSNGVVAQKDKEFTALLTVKDEENRVPINLLLTYSNEKKMMKVLSIPRDTYAPIYGNNDGTTSYDKLTLAYSNASGGAENVKTTVSKLFDIKIDYYAVIDIDTFSAIIDSVNGIDYDLKEDIQVRAISSVSFDFKKGTNHLNGEEVLALMMDATVGRSLDEEDLLNLINAVIDKAKNEIPLAQLKQITSEIEGNISIDQLVENHMEPQSIQSLSLIKGIKNERIEGSYYIKFEEDYLNSVSEELTTFN